MPRQEVAGYSGVLTPSPHQRRIREDTLLIVCATVFCVDEILRVRLMSVVEIATGASGRRWRAAGDD